MRPAHRKRVRSYNVPGDTHELTFSSFPRLPLLNRDRTRRLFVNNPVRRGLVQQTTDRVWSSARFYAGERQVLLGRDTLPCVDG
jgi:hypothetical protein